MNAVEIEEAVSKLVEDAFDAAEFPYSFLEAFGNRAATIQRLRSTGKNMTNKSGIDGNGIVAVLQRNNIHIATCVGDEGESDAVADLIGKLTNSTATTKHKAKFALATNGQFVHAASLNSDDPPLVCEFKELAVYFSYIPELAGISTVRQIRENAFDIKATGRLNRLYVELLRNNPDGRSTQSNSMGMRPMQQRVWQFRGEQYLLIKSPPASGKSRALMFVALDKLYRQHLKQAIVVVPEKSIGASFANTSVAKDGFFLGVEAFDDRLIAVDEFHHVSVSEDNRLGEIVRRLIERDRTHLIAMTGSYIEQYACDDIRVGDICQAAGVSERRWSTHFVDNSASAPKSS